MNDKFKIGDIIKVLSSPADLDKSMSKEGVITRAPFSADSRTGEVKEVYGVMLERGPSRQLVYGLAALPQHLELGVSTLVDDKGRYGRLEMKE